MRWCDDYDDNINISVTVMCHEAPAGLRCEGSVSVVTKQCQHMSQITRASPATNMDQDTCHGAQSISGPAFCENENSLDM